MVSSQIFFKKEGRIILNEKAFGDMLNLRTNLGAQVEVVCVCVLGRMVAPMTFKLWYYAHGYIMLCGKKGLCGCD